MDPIKRLLFPIILALGSATAAASPEAGACPPAGRSAAKLQQLKAVEFKIESPQARAQLAVDLLDCLASPDPELRDGIAFEAWYRWLRADQLDQQTRQQALDRLLAAIARDKADNDGFRHPFSALVLSEIARTDRKTPWMTPSQRAALLEAGAVYLPTRTRRTWQVSRRHRIW